MAALRHHLLYADGIAISDPIPKIFDHRYFSISPAEQALAYRRLRLANLARFLTEIDPLIVDDIIVFIQEPQYPDPFPYNARDLRRLAGVPGIVRAVSHLNREGREIAARAAESVLSQPEGSMPFGPESYAGFSLNGILAGMIVGSETGGSWDLYLPHREMQPVMNYVIKRAGGNLHGVNDRPELRLLHDLLSVELPGITDNIKTKDLVAIRRNGTAFAEWRDELQAALFELAYQLDSDPEMPQDARKRILRDRLSPAAAHARSEVGRSAALEQLKSGVVGTAIGTVLGLPFGTPAASAGAAGLSGLAGVVLSWLNGLPSRPTRKALARQYAVFTAKRQHNA